MIAAGMARVSWEDPALAQILTTGKGALQEEPCIVQARLSQLEGQGRLLEAPSHSPETPPVNPNREGLIGIESVQYVAVPHSCLKQALVTLTIPSSSHPLHPI